MCCTCQETTPARGHASRLRVKQFRVSNLHVLMPEFLVTVAVLHTLVNRNVHSLVRMCSVTEFNTLSTIFSILVRPPRASGNLFQQKHQVMKPTKRPSSLEYSPLDTAEEVTFSKGTLISRTFHRAILVFPWATTCIFLFLYLQNSHKLNFYLGSFSTGWETDFG